jgi:PEP-CTERM motif
MGMRFRFRHGHLAGYAAAILAGLFLQCVAPLSANAAVVRWQLNHFVFDDGGTVSGFFDWDSVADEAVNYDVLVQGGDVPTFTSFRYTDETTLEQSVVSNFGPFIDQVTIQFADAVGPGARILRIVVEPHTALDAPVGALAVKSFLECINCSPFRQGNSGASLSGAYVHAIPEPGSLPNVALAGTLLAAVLWRRRRTGGSTFSSARAASAP